MIEFGKSEGIDMSHYTQEEVKRLAAQYDLIDNIEPLTEFANAIAAELEAYKNDAGRYRWLRNRDLEDNFPSDGLFIGCIPENVCVSFDDADNAIDAAMQAEKGSDV